MLQKIIYGAAILLIIQIALIATLNSRQSGSDIPDADSSFAEIAAQKVSQLIITGDEEESVTLTKDDSGWVIKDAYRAPADDNKVEELLARLASARKGLAIATTPGSAKRFKTADDEFERHVVISDQEKVVVDFYIGTSAGFKSSHVRKAGEDAVFTIGVGGYELSVKPSDWLDKNLAKIDKEKVKQIEINGLTLARSENSWVLTEPRSEEIDPDLSTSLLDSIARLTVQDVYNPAEVSPLFETDAVKQFVITFDNDDRVTYVFAEKDDNYVLKMSDSELYLKVMAWQVDDLMEFNLEKLTAHDSDQEAGADIPDPDR